MISCFMYDRFIIFQRMTSEKVARKKHRKKKDAYTMPKSFIMCSECQEAPVPVRAKKTEDCRQGDNRAVRCGDALHGNGIIFHPKLNDLH